MTNSTSTTTTSGATSTTSTPLLLGAAVTTRVLAVACLLPGIPFGPGFSWRLFLGVALGFAWITAYAGFLLRAKNA